MSNFAMLRAELLAEIETIAPVVREYASQSEQLGRLAEPIIKAVRQTNLLRFICPHQLGGCEADPLTVMEVSEALSRIDGSVGWTLGIIANATAFAGAFLPAESARRVFGGGVPIIVGAVQPRNSTAEPVDGGYLVNGRWSFGSGIHFADWVLAGALVPVNHHRPDCGWLCCRANRSRSMTIGRSRDCGAPAAAITASITYLSRTT